MASPLVAFLGGAGKGYMDQKQQQLENDRRAAEDQRAQETHDASMAAITRDNNARMALVNAARPATVNVGANGMTKPDYADNSDVGQPGNPGADNGGLIPGSTVNGVGYTDPNAATQAAAAYNSPEAQDQRTAQAMAQSGSPLAAKQYQNTAAELAAKQLERARTMKQEGLMDAAQALRMGDAKGMVDAFNRGGQYKIVGEPVITKRDRTDIPGIESAPTYDAQVTYQRPDGTTATQTFNSHDLSASVEPFSKMLELTQKGTSNEARQALASSIAEVKGTLAGVTAETQRQRADAATSRADTLRDKLTFGGSGTADERKTYTVMAQDASRNANETRKAIAAFQLDNARAIKANPNGPEAQELAGMRKTLEEHQSNHSTAIKALGSLFSSPPAADAPPAPAGAPTAAPAGVPASAPALRSAMRISPAAQAQQDSDRPAILQAELKKAQDSLAAAASDPDPLAKQRAQINLDGVTREIGRLPAARPVSLAQARTPGTGPVKVTTQAQRDALPKGTSYIAPDGTTRIKQ